MSTTYDPCVLEPKKPEKVGSLRSHHYCNGEVDSMDPSKVWGISTLNRCLDHFTRPERLGVTKNFSASIVRLDSQTDVYKKAHIGFLFPHEKTKFIELQCQPSDNIVFLFICPFFSTLLDR
ncbi:hypothetical protein Ancab_035141 [Ancistrocladus abbreviatus]